MKQHTKWFASALAVTSSLIIAGSVRADVTVSDFQNITLSPTYGNWDVDGSQPINGGSGYTPTLTSVGTFGVNAQGSGSGHYDIPLGNQQLVPTDINAIVLSLTLNNISHNDAWMGIKFLLSDNQGNSDVWYGTYVGIFGVDGNWENANSGTAQWAGETLTMTVPLTSAMQSAVQTGNDQITGFSLVFDPAYYEPGSFPAYDITYNSLTLTTVPEPTTLALAGLGVAGLLVFRRRNK